MLEPAVALGKRPALVAVSGGSDSVALLHWLADQFPNADLHCATVDHGLRPEAADEARAVEDMAATLGYPHVTLKWLPAASAASAASASSADARAARYTLLHQHAREIDAALIALGHTMDDQAETVFMRALRSRADSDTRGLSGMTEWSSFHGMRLWRPLLNKTRSQLREKLTARSINWIDDPSNADLSYERVRTRALLSVPASHDLPASIALARLATLSGRTRQWINHQVADCIRQNVREITPGLLTFAPRQDLPRTLLLEILSCLVLIGGGQPFRSPNAKLADIADAMLEKQPATITLGRCLVSTKAGSTTVRRENRNLAEMPGQLTQDYVHDGRLLLRPSTTGSGIEISPYIEALETFRPSLDDPLHAAVMDLLDSPSCST